MQPLDDAALLTAYATHNSEEAFAELVRRYVALVYSAALRQVREPQLAEEVTQAVFILLARKARAVSRHPTLSGWLCRVTYFVSRDALRNDRRRLYRERVAAQMETSADTNWMQIAPLLDEVVAQLSDKDRSAIVLRFYEQKSLDEVGNVLGVNADAAQKRVSRALEKLRKLFARRGVSAATAIIAGAISANSVQAAPAVLASSVTSVALANGATASSSTLALIKGAVKLMAWSQVKTAVVASTVVLLAAGTTTVTIKEIQEHKTYSWQVPKADFAVLYKTPAQLKIVPTKFDRNGGTVCDEGRGAMGIAQSVEEIIHFAYEKDQLRTVIACELPTGRYDYFAKLPDSPIPSMRWATALQKEIARKFGVTGHLETRETDVFILKPDVAGVRGFKISHSMPNGRAMIPESGGSSFFEQPVTILAINLEQYVKSPIVDQTGLAERYDFTLKWDETGAKQPNLEGLKQALRDQLGLELVPAREPVEILIVEKVK